MSEYLSKEEIKQWRSSLEKITLEEFAARLGKKIEPTKPTNDLIDIVFQGKPVVSSTENEYKHSQAERLSTIAERAYEREQQIAPTPFSISNINRNITEEKPQKQKVQKVVEQKKEKPVSKKPAPVKKVQEKKPAANLREEVRIVFKKALTDREQKVFDHFMENRGKIVYAKELAELLSLPKDYVYKYIKNLRAKLDGNTLENADKGGFILNV